MSDSVKRILGEANYTRLGMASFVNKVNGVLKQLDGLNDEHVKQAANDLRQAMGRYVVSQNLEGKEEGHRFTPHELQVATMAATGSKNWVISANAAMITMEYDDVINALSDSGVYADEEDVDFIILANRPQDILITTATVPGTILVLTVNKGDSVSDYFIAADLESYKAQLQDTIAELTQNLETD